jgi:hypothetical protein
MRPVPGLHVRVFRVLAIFLAFLLAAASAGVVEAQMRIEGLAGTPPPQLLIFIVRGQGVATPLVAFQERARTAVEAHMHARVLSMDETLTRGGADFQNTLANCRGEPVCLSKLVGKVDAKYLLVISATELGDTRIVGSRLIDLGALVVVGEAVDEVGDTGNVLDAIGDRIKASIPADMWDPFGTLTITSNEPGAQLRVNGRTVGLSPAKPLGYLTPGEYKVEAEKQGFKIASGTFVVVRNKTTEAAMVLEEADGGGLHWGVWVGIGAAVVAGAVTAAVLVSSSGGEDPTFCSSPNPNLCP